MAVAGKQIAQLALILLILLLIICNVAFVYSSGWARLGWQLFGFGGLLGICWVAGLRFFDVGLSRTRLGSGIRYGLLAVAVIFAGFMIAYLIEPNWFRDDRYQQSMPTALYAALVLLPLKTVIFEELAFRGIMPALFKDIGTRFGIGLATSSLLFGMWHILSAPDSETASGWITIGGVFMVTTLGGAVFYYLKYRSDSLVAPILAHWFINGFAILLAAYSWLNQA